MSLIDDTENKIEKISIGRTPLVDSIQSKLERAFPSSVINVVDNSPSHAGHMESPKTGESTTHVQIQVISTDFIGVGILERHRRIYELLKSEILNLHAITIDAKTPK
jgi:BolA protein